VRAIPIDAFLEEVEERRAGTAALLPPAAYDWARLVAEGRAARAAVDGGRWRIGQLALLVERRYASGALQRFAEEIGERYATVRRYRWVAKAYDAAARTRFASLSFSHFQAVAGLPDRLAWLERAERGGWSVDRLIRESRARAPAPSAGGADAVERLREVLGRVARLIEPASLADDETLAEAGRAWLVDALDELAEQVARLRERVQRAVRLAEAAREPRSARPRVAPTARAARAEPARNGTRTGALKARAVAR
jgi:hypothetical protein